jgi:hypothetical protein
MHKPFAIVLAAGLAACASAQSTTESAALRIIDAPVVNLPDTAASAVPVVIDASAFNAETALMPLGKGETLRISIDRTRHHSDISTGWSGTAHGVEHGWFSFVQYDDAFHGIIGAGELGTFELRASGQHTDDGQLIYNLIKIDNSKFLGCATDELQQPARQGLRPVDISATPTPGTTIDTHNHADNPGGPLYNVDDGSVIDVMIVYTAEARTGWGGTNAIMALAQNCIDTTNTTYENSNIGPLELNLVHAQEVSYTESGSASTDIGRLQDDSDGHMDNVHPLRDQYGADLVALLVDSFNACGVGFLAPYDEHLGFTVTDTGCAVGNLSFPHEIGHNMGAHHDRDNAGSAPFPYAYGWRWNGNNGTQYRTVMAYSPGSRQPYFSNPDINFQGAPTGVNDSEDNARCHDNTRFSVAKFRDSVSTNDCIADTNNDGVLSPADFSAWVAAFNTMSAACDQNNDGSCTPADFSAWVANFNAGC